MSGGTLAVNMLHLSVYVYVLFPMVFSRDRMACEGVLQGQLFSLFIYCVFMPKSHGTLMEVRE